MPNWCDNKITIEHSDPAMLKRAKDAFLAERLLQEFIPCPDFEGNEWFGWCIEHWGTKWDVWEAEITNQTDASFEGRFFSAWTPPVAAVEVLEKDFGFKIRLLYFEPGVGFCGVYENGCDSCLDFAIQRSLPEFAELDALFSITAFFAEAEDEEVSTVETPAGAEN